MYIKTLSIIQTLTHLNYDAATDCQVGAATSIAVEMEDMIGLRMLTAQNIAHKYLFRRQTKYWIPMLAHVT
jgi:hypothetical protein